MNPSWKQWYWQLKLASYAAIASVVTLVGDYALAQISADGTLSTQVTTPDNLNFTLTDGNRVGSNVFHSFREFSIPTGGSAFFDNALDIQNIISRVTGRSASNIDGLLQANGTANLFLLNPNGIIFGPNAELDIGGSFVGSTARSLKFADGTEFSATADPTTPLLTISVPIGLQYGGSGGNILVQGSNLQVQPGNTLALVGGDVNLDGATLIARGGRVEVGGVADSGTIGLSVNGNNLDLSFGDGVARSNVSLTNEANIRATAGGGGSIEINARNIDVLGGSFLVAGIAPGRGSAGIEAGDITLNATEAITIGQSSTIQNDIFPEATGKGGNINIEARSLSLTDESSLSTRTFGQGDAGSISLQVNDAVSIGQSSSIQNDVLAEATGKGGNINIQARSLSLRDESSVSTRTFGQGDAGSISLQVNDTVSAADRSVIFSSVFGEAIGSGGNIDIQTRKLSLTGGSVVLASTFAAGEAGDITLNATETITIGQLSSIQNEVLAEATGKGGNINIRARSLSLADQSFLSTRTFGQGDAGSISLQVNDTVSVADSSFIFSYVFGEATGNGGNIDIQTRKLSLTDGSEVLASTFAAGNAGNIQVNASDSINISGVSPARTYPDGFVDGGYSSGLFTSAEVESPTGRGGNIQVTTNSLQLSDGAVLSARTFNAQSGGNITVNVNTLELRGGGQLLTTAYSSGPAGNITVNAADSVTLSGNDPTYFDRLAQFGRLVVDNDGPTSALSARSQSDGDAGNVTVTTGQLRVEDGAKIAVSGEQSGNAGNLTVNASSIFLNQQGQLIASTASGEGGNINLQAQDLLLLRRNSQISTNAGGTGNGGNIEINSQFLVAVPIEDSDITANAVRGRGGNINITTQGIYGQKFRRRPTPLSDITASSEFGVNGVVQINTPDLDPSKGLAALSGELVDVSGLVASGCEVAESEQSSQFVVTGRGGVPPNPNETLRHARVLVDLGTPSDSQESALSTNSPYPRVRSTTDIQHPSSFSNRTAPLVEATGWVMDSKGEVILTDKAPTVTSHSSWLRTSSCEGR